MMKLLLCCTITIVVVIISASSTLAVMLAAPKRLRAPLTTWTSPEFSLRSVFHDDQHHSSHDTAKAFVDAADRQKLLRYVELYSDEHEQEKGADSMDDDDKKPSHGPIQRERGSKDDDSDPFWSGKALEDPRLVVQFDPEVVAMADPVINKSPVKRMQVVLNIHAWGVPCWRAVLRKVDASDATAAGVVVSESEIICYAATVKGHFVDLHMPSTEALIDAWNSKDTLWRVSAEFEQPEITTFSLLSPQGLDAEVMTTGAKFDVTPQNATMGFKFMIQVNRDADKPDEEGKPGGEYFELWAFRKPPIPDFRLSLYVDQQVVFSEPIHDVGATANAYGVKHRLEEHTAVNFTGRPVAMFCTFVERRRQFVAKVRVNNFAEAVQKGLFDSPLPEGRNYHEAVLEAESGELEAALGVKEPVKVVVRRYPQVNMVGLYVDFPVAHVQNTMVSFWMLDAKTMKRSHLFLREGDSAVPPKSEMDHHLYGWDDAFPLAGDGDDEEEDVNQQQHQEQQEEQQQHQKKKHDDEKKELHSALSSAFEIDVQFDLHHHLAMADVEKDMQERQRPLESLTEQERIQRGLPRLSKNSVQPLSAMFEAWVHSIGGSCNNVDLTFLDVPHHSHARPHPLLLTVALPKFVRGRSHISTPSSVVASVPMYSVFSASLAEGTGWGAVLRRHDQSLRDHIVEESLHPDALQFLYLTLATMSHVYDGSHNYRPLFRIFEESSVNLPPLYHTEELGLFSFSDGFLYERRRMINLWSEEYTVVTRCERKLKREITREMYFFHRSQVEARAINGTSGEMELIPVVDFAPHSDEPSAEVIFDAREGLIALAPLRDLAAGDAVTINYGTVAGASGAKQAKKTALGFLLQHGIVPGGARQSVTFIEKGTKPGDERAFTLVEGAPESIEPYVELLRLGKEKFFSPNPEVDTATPAEIREAEKPARKKLLQIVSDKLALMPSSVPEASDAALVAGEKAKQEEANKRMQETHHHHHHKHFKQHRAHHERSLEHLRASFDAARDQAMALLLAEKSALQYFVDLLRKEEK